jgi:hypothetical protein
MAICCAYDLHLELQIMKLMDKQVTKCFLKMSFPLQLFGSKFEAFEILI